MLREYPFRKKAGPQNRAAGQFVFCLLLGGGFTSFVVFVLCLGAVDFLVIHLAAAMTHGKGWSGCKD